MPKLKTHSGAKKRFKLSAKGKLKYKKAGLRHLLTGMSTNRGRRLRKISVVNPVEAKRIRQLIQR